LTRLILTTPPSTALRQTLDTLLSPVNRSVHAKAARPAH
jgi:hypothetical protein